MSGFDFNSPSGGFGMPPPMFGGMPGPQFNPLGSGNPSIDLAFATYGAPMLQQFMGGNKFLPQQFPAQGVLDQMMAAKYHQASRANLDFARQTDQKTIYNNLIGMRSKFDNTPLSATGQAQMNNAASYINSEPGQMIASMLLGPQNAEDLFFGRRGSAVQLAQSVNKIGYYRPDSVTGHDRMSQKSLEQFSSQVYDNLYGKNADLNDVSGFSAGRVGTLMGELAQRGLLPESVSKLSAGGRRKALGEKGMDKLGLSTEITDAIGAGSSLEDIDKIAGGADGVRKIDATRVSNSLKGYTDALGVVREIFGDNGITNAPMQQLMAAMEALTQGGTSTMKAGGLENLMRRTQMASRDSGVSLEGLMGLTARSGALADQYGLSRELAAGNVVSSMERVRALQDTGGFAPGFGRLDPTKAGLFALDQGMRADSSRVGKYMGAAARLVAESGENGMAGTRMRSMVEALQRGESSFYDASQGRNVNIHEELGRNPDQFMRGMLQEAGISNSHFSALARDPNSQEYLSSMSGSLAAAQSAEVKQRIARNAIGRTNLGAILGKGMSKEDSAQLKAMFGEGFSATVVDTVSTQMTAEERVDALESSARQSFRDYVRTKNPGMSEDQINQTSDQMVNDRFGDAAGLRKELSRQYAEAGIFTQGKLGTSLSVVQQMMSERGVDEFGRRHARNKNRAGVMDDANIGDGSNFLQRFSDMLGAGNNGRPALEQILGSIDSLSDQDKLLEGIGGNNTSLRGAFEDIQKGYAAGTINTDDERAAMVARAESDFAGVKAQFAGTGAEGGLKNKTKYMTTAQLAANLEAGYKVDSAGGAGNSNHFKALYKSRFKDATQAEIDETFKDPAKRKKALEELAGIAGIETEFEKRGVSTGVGGNTITQASLTRLALDNDAFAVGADRGKIAAMGKLGREWNSGSVTSQSILGALGHGNAAKDKQLTESMQAFINGDKAGTIESVGARLGQLGITGEAASKVLFTARFSKNLKELGGFDSLGTATFAERAAAAGRKEAIDSRVKSGVITGDVAKAIKKQEAGETLTPEEKALVEGAYKGDKKVKLEFDAAKAGKGSQSEVASELEKEAKQITDRNTGAGSASDPSGIGASVANAMSTMFKDIFKGEMKFDNVTIANVKVLSGIDSLAANASSGGNEGLKISGSITINGLRDGVAAFIAEQANKDAQPPGSTPPVKGS